MALWNPFNLFKKKEKPAAAPPVEAAKMESGTMESRAIELENSSPASEQTQPFPVDVAMATPEIVAEPVGTTPDTGADSIPAS